jgi:hypothetical protein
MKETFEVIEEMKRAGVIDDYAVADAVGAIFYVEAFATLDIDFLINLSESENLLVSLKPIHDWLGGQGYSELDKGGHYHLKSGKIAAVRTVNGGSAINLDSKTVLLQAYGVDTSFVSRLGPAGFEPATKGL